MPVRYEDAVRECVNGRGNTSVNADTALNSDTALNADTVWTAGPNAAPVTARTPAVVDDGAQRTAPKPKAQVIAELAPKLQKPGTTPGRAAIAAEQIYAEAERRFASNAQTVLEMLQPGQDPRRFLDGFQNAYILGKQGNHAALDRSSAAAYLTQLQRQYAFELGVNGGKSIPAHTGVMDARDRLSAIPLRGTSKIAQGFSAFPEGDILNERIKRVKPDGDKFDVAMHGSPTAVAFGGSEANMSPRLLAQIILRSEGYHGQDIRLLSCSTGAPVDGGYCFAEELANALGVTVWAPNDLLMVNKNGIFYIGLDGSGRMVDFAPNERGRIK